MCSSLARWMQGPLFTMGFLLLGYCGADWINSEIQQRAGIQELDRILSQKSQRPATAIRSGIPEGDLVGKVEIPKLHLSAVVFQGTTNKTLDRGVGHLDGSALPGESGNVVLAAHRDSYFRSLRHIQKGDAISVTTPGGTREYKVASMEIVDPTDLAVAEPTSTPTLTLITCYPFYYVGHAPKRFVVKARDLANNITLSQARGMPNMPEESADLTYVFRASKY
ncbi:MAG: class D sortase [Acidobacteriota bacterium]|nr:class D sortase [Acidobacteriota bacterium]